MDMTGSWITKWEKLSTRPEWNWVKRVNVFLVSAIFICLLINIQKATNSTLMRSNSQSLDFVLLVSFPW
jgi:hypothetical protein